MEIYPCANFVAKILRHEEIEKNMKKVTHMKNHPCKKLCGNSEEQETNIKMKNHPCVNFVEKILINM